MIASNQTLLFHVDPHAEELGTAREGQQEGQAPTQGRRVCDYLAVDVISLVVPVLLECARASSAGATLIQVPSEYSSM